MANSKLGCDSGRSMFWKLIAVELGLGNGRFVKSSTFSMKFSISEVIAGPGLWGMAGGFIAGLLILCGCIGRGRFVVWDTDATLVGLDISIKEILGLFGFGLGTDIAGLLFVTVLGLLI